MLLVIFQSPPEFVNPKTSKGYKTGSFQICRISARQGDITGETMVEIYGKLHPHFHKKECMVQKLELYNNDMLFSFQPLFPLLKRPLMGSTRAELLPGFTIRQTKLC
ncbi:Uncharacterized protein TCM_016590 [Theobroma cacao]|uniref:Uncharacterized protein n=1 Tax=Theobroma cacao TaxID=3641 RepID=A0A061G5V5_THECC|nr:Uncharacterized protein TCM_016590 [Theobroma cacao]